MLTALVDVMASTVPTKQISIFKQNSSKVVRHFSLLFTTEKQCKSKAKTILMEHVTKTFN